MSISEKSVFRRPQIANQAEWALILLHGVGSTGRDIISLSDHLAENFPTVAFCAPDGVAPSDTNERGRQWFSIIGVTEENRKGRLLPALSELNLMIDKEAATIGLDRSRVILLGFSQGTIMALHLAASGSDIAGVIGLSGRLAGPVLVQELWPPIALIHGTQDPIISIDVARDTATWLHDAGSKATLTEIEGLGHQIDDRALSAASDALYSIVTGAITF